MPEEHRYCQQYLFEVSNSYCGIGGTNVKPDDPSEEILGRPAWSRPRSSFRIFPYAAQAYLSGVSCVCSIECVVVLHRW